MANRTTNGPTVTTPQRTPLLPNAVLGVLIFIITEIMFFAGMISAFVIARAGTPSGLWPPPDQARLPVEATAGNTVVLLLSGILLFAANSYFSKDRAKSQKLMLGSLIFGAFFVLFQGYEWIQLIGEGLTMHSSNHGAFFYLVVGSHALHAVVGLTALSGLFFRFRSGELTTDVLSAGSIYWYFVVGLWPILYWQVYL